MAELDPGIVVEEHLMAGWKIGIVYATSNARTKDSSDYSSKYSTVWLERLAWASMAVPACSRI